MENKVPILYVMVGLPGSGKSHIAEELSKEKNAVVYSMDEIRGELCGDVGDQSRNDEVFGIWVNRIRRTLKHGQNVIADATNVTKSGRRSFLAMFDRIPHQTIAHVAYKEVEDCIIDNLDRPHPVPPDVIYQMANKFSYPTETEGFTEIITHFYDRQKEEIGNAVYDDR